MTLLYEFLKRPSSVWPAVPSHREQVHRPLSGALGPLTLLSSTVRPCSTLLCHPRTYARWVF